MEEDYEASCRYSQELVGAVSANRELSALLLDSIYRRLLEKPKIAAVQLHSHKLLGSGIGAR